MSLLLYLAVGALAIVGIFGLSNEVGPPHSSFGRFEANCGQDPQDVALRITEA